MTNARFTAVLMLITALCKKVLKYLALPFLFVWIVIKCIYVLIVGIIAVVVLLAKSIVDGRWKI